MARPRHSPRTPRCSRADSARQQVDKLIASEGAADPHCRPALLADNHARVRQPMEMVGRGGGRTLRGDGQLTDSQRPTERLKDSCANRAAMTSPFAGRILGEMVHDRRLSARRDAASMYSSTMSMTTRAAGLAVFI